MERYNGIKVDRFQELKDETTFVKREKSGLPAICKEVEDKLRVQRPVWGLPRTVSPF